LSGHGVLPGDERQVARNQRKDTGRGERHQAGGEGQRRSPPGLKSFVDDVRDHRPHPLKPWSISSARIQKRPATWVAKGVSQPASCSTMLVNRFTSRVDGRGSPASSPPTRCLSHLLGRRYNPPDP